MARWPLLFACLLGCSLDSPSGGGGDGAGFSESTGEPDDPTTGDPTMADGNVDDGMTEATAEGPITTDASSEDEGSSDDGGPSGPTCGGVFWRAEMDVDPTTLDDNGDDLQDWEYNAGAFPADTIVDGVWQAAPGAYVRTLPDNPLATRVIINLRLRATSENPRGALFWANLGQEDDSVTRLWLEISLGAGGKQRALVGGYSTSDTPEVLLDVPDLGTDFINVVFDADPDTGEVDVLLGGVDRGTLQLPSYAGSNPQAAAIGTLDASAEIDTAIVEVCPE
jgi:hypothetical protein